MEKVNPSVLLMQEVEQKLRQTAEDIPIDSLVGWFMVSMQNVQEFRNVFWRMDAQKVAELVKVHESFIDNIDLMMAYLASMKRRVNENRAW